MVNIPKIFKEDDSKSGTIFLPLLPLRDIVVFPHMVAPLFVGRTKSVNALSDAMNKDKSVLLATQKKAGIDPVLCIGCDICRQICPTGAIQRPE